MISYQNVWALLRDVVADGRLDGEELEAIRVAARALNRLGHTGAALDCADDRNPVVQQAMASAYLKQVDAWPDIWNPEDHWLCRLLTGTGTVLDRQELAEKLDLDQVERPEPRGRLDGVVVAAPDDCPALVAELAADCARAELLARAHRREDWWGPILYQLPGWVVKVKRSTDGTLSAEVSRKGEP